ncbi:hypothetical protein ACSTS3_08595 [Aquimarina muelleri]|uniref:hypothetical protein n=1 Tax=Aquimarina muelleri TaxID=279356 RepID=UPI003F68824D
MKTIKTIFTILFLTTMFMACEADSVNEEVGIELNDTIGEEVEDGQGVEPPKSSKKNNK